MIAPIRKQGRRIMKKKEKKREREKEGREGVREGKKGNKYVIKLEVLSTYCLGKEARLKRSHTMRFQL